MKTPRITDFDPNAPVRELGSPLDDLPVIERAQRPESSPYAEERDRGAHTGAAHTGAPVLPYLAAQAAARTATSSVTTDAHAGVAAIRSPVQAVTPPPLPVPSGPYERDVLPRPPVRPVPLRRRPIKQRHPFDIYDDQLESLRRLALEERMRGGVGSMSAMVREALDAYIGQRAHIPTHSTPIAESDEF